jgi:hypothetical protein
MHVALVGLALWPRGLSWAGSAGIIFLVELLAVQYLLPAYNRQFGLRSQLLHASSREHVVCYPQRFDSVSFYLPRSQVHAFGPDQRRELIAHLHDHPGTLVLVKSGPILDEFMRKLPPGVLFTTRQRGGAITAGRVISRDTMPRLFAASRRP